MFYSQFYGFVSNYDTYLNIDEGQDLSISDFRLLRLINGASTVFNIYGDINQLISKTGINDWSQLNEVSKLFYLNENYRNTIEVTKFCNDKLMINSIPIEISGNIIESINTHSLLGRIQELKNKDVHNRIAIIVTKQDIGIIESCIEIGCIAGKIKNGKISVLTVEESKGLEFDLVYVYSKNMTRNQKYISYTRSLNKLVLVS